MIFHLKPNRDPHWLFTSGLILVAVAIMWLAGIAIFDKMVPDDGVNQKQIQIDEQFKRDCQPGGLLNPR